MIKKKDVIKKNKVLLFLILSIIIFELLFLYTKKETKYNFKKPIIFLEEKKIIKKTQTEIENQKELINKIKKVEVDNSKIIAKSYVIYDLKDEKILAGLNENKKYALASVSKLMTSYVALKVCRDDLKLELDKILIESDNIAADNVADNCPNFSEFVEKMNYYTKFFNLNMSFENPSGLDKKDETEATNFGDAVSVAKLINILQKENPKLLFHTANNYYKNYKNTNEYAETYPFLIGSKTGYTDMAGGNLATIFEIGPDEKIAIVVLNSTKEGRFQDVKYLLKSYLEN
jgi:D-alanyl-D-alanine carboxypeptidase